MADGPRGTAVSSLPARAAQDAGALREVTCLFLRLGTTAFGGPAAHIAMMEDEVVRRRRWLTRAEFLSAALLLVRYRVSSAWLVLIVVEQARHRGVHVGWRDYLKVGLPVTVLTLGLDLTLLGLLE